MDKLLNYSEITLIPELSKVESRSKCCTKIFFGERFFRMPIIPANMKCVINFELAEWLSENDYFYIMHRFLDYKNLRKWIKNNQHLKTISISLGVQDKDWKFMEQLCHESSSRIDFITIDIAHGHSYLMKDMINQVKMHSDAKIIAGNVCTKEGVADLVKWGADIIKCGISHGSACSTYGKTGFGVPGGLLKL